MHEPLDTRNLEEQAYTKKKLRADKLNNKIFIFSAKFILRKIFFAD